MSTAKKLKRPNILFELMFEKRLMYYSLYSAFRRSHTIFTLNSIKRQDALHKKYLTAKPKLTVRRSP